MEKIRNKYKNISNLKLYKKVERAKFGVNFVLVLSFFIILGFFVWPMSFIPANLKVLSFLYKILSAVILIFIGFKLDEISKKIELPCEIEQNYRISHINPDNVIGCKTIKSLNGIIDFKVNEKIKKRLKYKNIVTTFGGKIAVALIIILFLLTITLPLYMLNNKDYIVESLQLIDENIVYVIIVGIFIFFAVCTLIAIICTFKQRIKVEDNTLIDILKTDGKYLIYQYRLGTKKYVIDGYYIDLIDLSEVNAFYYKSNKSIFIQGKIDEIHLTNPKEISKVKDQKSFLEFVNYIKNETNKIQNEKNNKKNKNVRIRIYNYFEPNLIKFFNIN